MLCISIMLLSNPAVWALSLRLVVTQLARQADSMPSGNVVGHDHWSRIAKLAVSYQDPGARHKTITAGILAFEGGL